MSINQFVIILLLLIYEILNIYICYLTQAKVKNAWKFRNNIQEGTLRITKNSVSIEKKVLDIEMLDIVKKVMLYDIMFDTVKQIFDEHNNKIAVLKW